MCFVPEYITAAEFGRWRTDFVAFRAELHSQLHEGFLQMNQRLDDINGRGRTNAEGLAVLTARIDKVDEDDGEIRTAVKDIQAKGCAQLANHGAVVKTLQRRADADADVDREWPPKKRLVVGGGLLAGGAGLWELVHGLLDHFLTR